MPVPGAEALSENQNPPSAVTSWGIRFGCGSQPGTGHGFSRRYFIGLNASLFVFHGVSVPDTAVPSTSRENTVPVGPADSR